MTEELKSAIEDLYNRFSKYHLNTTIAGCSCCVSEQDRRMLHTKSLRNLNGDDLGKYSFKAMTTWGDVNDFKHFLPRIFELLVTTEFPSDIFVVLGKLDYGKWKDWDTEETDALKKFLLAWWACHIKTHEDFNGELFMEIYLKTGDVRLLLDRWIISFSNNSFKALVDFVYNEVQLLNDRKKIFSYKNIEQDTINKINAWLLSQLETMEKGFYHFEKSEPEFSEKASIAYDIIKGLKKG